MPIGRRRGERKERKKKKKGSRGGGKYLMGGWGERERERERVGGGGGCVVVLCTEFCGLNWHCFVGGKFVNISEKVVG